MNLIIKQITFNFLLFIIFSSPQCSLAQNTVELDKMTISWEFENDKIIFSLTSPTTGWQAIGFNKTSQLKGTYLIMGRIVDGKAEVNEHYTASPGNYNSLTTYGLQQRATVLDSKETNNMTFIRFSIPTSATDTKHKALTKGSEFSLLYAYSLEDDFQHHSIFRSSTIIKL